MQSTISPGVCPQEASGIVERQTNNKALEENVRKTVTKTHVGYCGEGETIFNQANPRRFSRNQ